MAREEGRSPFKVIVAGVDFSTYSHIVLRQARLLARHFRAKLTLVYVNEDFSLPRGKRDASNIPLELQDTYGRKLKQFYRLSSHEAVDFRVRFGRADEELVRECKKIKRREMPLLVVGHRGHGALDLILGSTAEKLALTSTVPVWIHRGEKVKIPEKILIPYDLTPESERAIRWARRLFTEASSQKEIFHVSRPPTPILDFETWADTEAALRERRDHALKRARNKFTRFPFEEREGDPVTLICQEAAKFDLIAMTPHSHLHMMPTLGSVTARVIRKGEKPVLVCKKEG